MSMTLDAFDLRLLDALQRDASLSRDALADAVGLSASQVARRRQALEEAGVIRRYRAEVDPAAIGLAILVFMHVKLHAHSPANSKRFHAFVRSIPEVLEAHSLTGDFDYLLQVRVGSLPDLARLVNEVLLPHESVDRVRSDIVLETLREDRILRVPGIAR
jgi:DNA-binding Lrp family transcriptional regulator